MATENPTRLPDVSWARARTLCGRSKWALGVRGICLHSMSWGIIAAVIAGSCLRSSELDPRGLRPPHAACSPGWEDWGPAGSPPAVPQVGEGPRISAGGTSGCNLGGGSCGDRQATCRASCWSRYTAVYLGWSVGRDTGAPILHVSASQGCGCWGWPGFSAPTQHILASKSRVCT